MQNWNKYFTDAERYSKAAFGAFNHNKLGNFVVYNLICLALENYFTAICIALNTLPEHSSISGMIHFLKKRIDLPASFQAESRFINKFMGFCSLEIHQIIKPTRADLVRMLGFTEEVKYYFQNEFANKQGFFSN